MSAMGGVARVERELAHLDEIPDHLLRVAVRVRIGTLSERIAGVIAWRTALLAGELPPASPAPWPGFLDGSFVRGAFESLGIARFCAGREDLVDAIVEGLLRDAAAAVSATEHMVEEHMREFRAAAAGAGETWTEAELEEQVALARKEQGQDRAALLSESVELAWAERVAAWTRVADVFGELGELLGGGFDLAQGILRHHGWKDLAALSALLSNEPRLRELVATLGRATGDGAAGTETVIERFVASLSRVGEVEREVEMPGIPPDVRGVTRSDDLARVLPSDAALLRHPVARRLFFARWAERSLATYQVEGVAPQRMTETIAEDVEADREVTRAGDRAGPIMLCVDTSGSMAGEPETIAKAIALEAMRIAHREGRRCVVWTFSGPGQVVMHELRMDEAGIATLLAFLLASFHGGTDVGGAVEAACAKVAEDAWRRADLAIVTDGAFGVSQETLALVEDARERHGLRVRGLLVGGTSDAALRKLAGEVEHVASWTKLRSRHG